MVFITTDGIFPSNEGRGYVLRRLIRRAARHGKLLGIKQGFLSGLTDRVIEVSGEAYPEIVEKSDYIKKIISVEEDRFAQTIDQGTDIIGGYIEEMKRSGNTVLDGEKMFKLYDTFGFPPELTEEILAENGFTANIKGSARGANMRATICLSVQLYRGRGVESRRGPHKKNDGARRAGPGGDGRGLGPPVDPAHRQPRLGGPVGPVLLRARLPGPRRRRHRHDPLHRLPARRRPRRGRRPHRAQPGAHHRPGPARGPAYPF